MICLRKFLAGGCVLVFGSALAGGALLASLRPQAPSQAQPPVAPQPAPAPAPRRTPTIRASTELVVVPVTVKDAKGRLIGDLRRDEFRIFEDGQEQNISLFSVETTPISAVVAVDGDLKRSADKVQKSLIDFAGSFSDIDEVALGRFDAFFTPLLDFTTDNDALITALKHMDLKQAFSQGSPQGSPGPTLSGRSVPGAPSAAQLPARLGMSTKHINDAVYAAAQLLRTRDPLRRRMIILVSDGTNAKNNTHTYEEAMRMLLSSNISVYAIGVDSAVILRGTTVLSRYAHSTGGDVYYAAGAGTLPDLYAQVTEQARHQYTLGYLPQETDRARLYHSIEVRIRRPGLTLLTRDGYYSLPTR